MTSQPDTPTERQVLYALVSGGFIVVVAVLVIGAAYAGLVPTWWSVVASAATVAVGALSAKRWRDTRLVLIASIMLFLVWTVVTLLVR